MYRPSWGFLCGCVDWRGGDGWWERFAAVVAVIVTFSVTDRHQQWTDALLGSLFFSHFSWNFSTYCVPFVRIKNRAPAAYQVPYQSVCPSLGYCLTRFCFRSDHCRTTPAGCEFHGLESPTCTPLTLDRIGSREAGISIPGSKTARRGLRGASRVPRSETRRV